MVYGCRDQQLMQCCRHHPRKVGLCCLSDGQRQQRQHWVNSSISGSSGNTPMLLLMLLVCNATQHYYKHLKIAPQKNEQTVA